MSRDKMRIAIAVLFFVVGVLAMYNTWELNRYVRETTPRDAAQEACVRDAVTTINLWVNGLTDTGSVFRKRDQAIMAVLNPDGTPPTPEELAALGQSVGAASDAWAQYQKMIGEHPLVVCTPK